MYTHINTNKQQFMLYLIYCQGYYDFFCLYSPVYTVILMLLLLLLLLLCIIFFSLPLTVFQNNINFTLYSNVEEFLFKLLYTSPWIWRKTIAHQKLTTTHPLFRTQTYNKNLLTYISVILKNNVRR